MNIQKGKKLTKLSDLIVLCQKTGIVLPANEIYQGFTSSFDFGPIGTLLKRNVETNWWRNFVAIKADVHAIDSALLSPSIVWEKSGHINNFSDSLVDCFECKKRFRSGKFIYAFFCAYNISLLLIAISYRLI